MSEGTVQTTFDGKEIAGGIKDWSFAKADTKYQTHGLHPYPARMIPQIARKLVLQFSKPKETVLDPFCGSGTVLVECRLLGRNGIGNDINPLATLISSVKSTPIEPTRLEKRITKTNKEISSFIKKAKEGRERIKSPTFYNIEHWFKPYVIRDLACIGHSIETVDDDQIRNALKVCYSITILRSSNMDFDNSPTHPRAIPSNRLNKHNPNPKQIFQEASRDLISRMIIFYRNAHKDVDIKITTMDTRELKLDRPADLIVTSPPYGEEQNTIGYTRWSKLVLYWLGLSQREVSVVRKTTLGSKKSQNIDLSSPLLNEILQKVEKAKPPLSKRAKWFFGDYQKCLHNIEKLLRRKAYCCIVVGNRSIMGNRIPMDIVTKEMVKHMNFQHVATYHRTIPNKDMPYSNVAGKTISRENIILLKYIGD